MRLGRRSFLKLASGLVAATVAAPVAERISAPLFIPSDRLEMGVPRAIYFPPEDWSIGAPYDHDRALAQLRGPRDWFEVAAPQPRLIQFFATGDEITAERANEIVENLRGVGGNVPERFIHPAWPGDLIDFASLAELQCEVAKANTATLNVLMSTAGVHQIPPGVYPLVGSDPDAKLIAGDNARLDVELKPGYIDGWQRRA